MLLLLPVALLLLLVQLLLLLLQQQRRQRRRRRCWRWPGPRAPADAHVGAAGADQKEQAAGVPSG